jgi:hypothetical protein
MDPFDPTHLSNLSLVKIAHGKMAQMLLLQIFSKCILPYMSIECESSQ